MDDRVIGARASIPVPEGVRPTEALLLLQVFARIKAQRFGRVALTVSDGRLVDVEVTEKLDRHRFFAL